MLDNLVRASAAGVLALGVALPASAATLSVVGGYDDNLGSAIEVYDPTPAGGGADGDAVTAFNGIGGEGLMVDGPSRVTITFVGYEAGFTNRSVAFGDEIINKDNMFGSFLTGVVEGGFIDFSFVTDLGGDGFAEIFNGGLRTADSMIRFAVSSIFNEGRSVFAYFDDSGNGIDADFDDMVVRIDVAPVPLPAGGVLLLTALSGLALARRRQA